MAYANLKEADIIDLTSPPPPLESVVFDSDTEFDLDVSTGIPYDFEKFPRETQRKKFNKSLGGTDGGGLNKMATTDMNPPELNTSGRHGKRKREIDKHNREMDHDLQRRRVESTQLESPKPPHANIFFVDVQPTPLDIMPPSTFPQEEPAKKLLLPAHVTVFGTTPAEILPESIAEEDEDDFINYLDLDDTRTLVRYYESPPTPASVLTRSVCKNCGAEGEHKTSACPVLICLTCGVRNEHSTRSCPISKVCFTCGMKGHINSSCPNRRLARSASSRQSEYCDRCSSSLHRSNECPTWWRIYEYLTEDERLDSLDARRRRKGLALGQGGEGYVADDEWCYRCGSSGHWGDDCCEQETYDQPVEPSAFSSYNLTSGPFDTSRQKEQAFISRNREFRESELASDWGANAPELVGRRAKKKAKAALEQTARKQQEAENDSDNWFETAKKHSGEIQHPPQKVPKKLSFGTSLRGRLSDPSTPSTPSLLDRLGDDYSHQRHSSTLGPPHRSSSSRRRLGGRHRDDERAYRVSSRGRSERRDDYGPRYKGGYS